MVLVKVIDVAVSLPRNISPTHNTPSEKASILKTNTTPEPYATHPLVADHEHGTRAALSQVAVEDAAADPEAERADADVEEMIVHDLSGDTVVGVYWVSKIRVGGWAGGRAGGLQRSEWGREGWPRRGSIAKSTHAPSACPFCLAR